MGKIYDVTLQAQLHLHQRGMVAILSGDHHVPRRGASKHAHPFCEHARARALDGKYLCWPCKWPHRAQLPCLNIFSTKAYRSAAVPHVPCAIIVIFFLPWCSSFAVADAVEAHIAPSGHTQTGPRQHSKHNAMIHYRPPSTASHKTCSSHLPERSGNTRTWPSRGG